MLTLKQASENQHGFSFTTRAEITKVAANESYPKCSRCWRKMPDDLYCVKCNFKNYSKEYSLLLKVLILIEKHTFSLTAQILRKSKFLN